MITDDFLRYLEAEKDASPLTVRTYGEAINDYLGYLGRLEGNISPEDADGDIVRGWVESMVERGYKATNTCKKLSAVKSLYRYALRKGIIECDPAHNVPGPKKQKTLPVFLRETEAEELFDGLQWDMSNIKDVRARTLLLMLYSTGMRRAEIISLRDKDVSLARREVKVTGKRRKQRIIPLGQEMIDALALYQQMRDEEILVTDDTEALFRNDKGKQMTDAQVYGMVKKYLSLVTTQKKRSPHVMRHSFATAMLNHDAKLGSVQKLLGHESLNTTQIYTHVTFEELKRTYSKAHPRETE
jgi:integrase/recombinase XerC